MFDKLFQMCIWDRKADYSHNLFFACVGVGVPVVLVAACNLFVYLYVRKNEIKVQPTQSNTTSSSLKAERMSARLSRTFTVIFVVFIVCWTPYCLLILFDTSENAPPVFYIFSTLIAHVNSGINYILYAATNPDFRRGYVKIVSKLRAKLRPGQQPAAPSRAETQLSQFTRKSYS